MLNLMGGKSWRVAVIAAVAGAGCGGPAATANDASPPADGSTESASPGGPDGAVDGGTAEAGGDSGASDSDASDGGSSDGGSSDGADGGAATDSAVKTDADAGDFGMPSSNYPAFSPDVGQIVYQGGTVLKQPVIVPITWNADNSQATFEAYADRIGQSAYWQEIGKDYGVGAATSGGHVRDASTPPATLTDQDIQNAITSGGVFDAGAAVPWPVPTANTIYAFFLAPGTSLLLGGAMPMDACQQGIGGYHGAVHSTALGGDVAYAVVPSCLFGGIGSNAAESTGAMSHELIEAATDPLAADRNVQNVGWYSFDQNHFDWMYFNELQAEVGDTCEFYQEAFFQNDSSFPYFLQRIWSNSSIAAGHHPCVPAPPGAYFNVTPLDLTPVSVTIPGLLLGGGMPQTMQTKGVRILAGQSGTFTVGFYSDAPTSGPWTISATPGNPILGTQGDFLAQYNQSQITASVDKTSGINGEKAHVTVSVTSTGATFSGELLTITSTLSGVSHYMPIWISGE
jgi:hypothetical protein